MYAGMLDLPLCFMNSPSIIFSMSQSFKLFRLQQIDSSLDKGQARLLEIERQLDDDLEIRLAKQKFDKAQNEKFTSEKELRVAEDNVKQQRLKIERSQAALYGGKISNPKELQDLQHESEALKRYLGTLEDLQLEAMLALDEADSQFLQAETSLTETGEQVAAEKEHLSKDRSGLLRDLEINESERAAALSNIDAQDLRLYETLRKQKNGIAVARIVDKTCAACGSTLTASTYSSAKVPTKLTRCDSCGRILYAG
jgi:predicted  nucleic acid-binding Zn-ribbon protein